MTWAKYGTEFFDQLVDASFPDDLDDACQLTHTQALHYLYSVEAMDMTFPKNALPRFATSRKAEAAARILSDRGIWEDRGSRYKVLHHEDIFRQSLGYQLKERVRSKEAMRKRRGKGPDGNPPPGVTQDVTRHVMRTQSDSHSANTKKDLPDFDSETGEVLDDPPKLHAVDDIGYDPDAYEDYLSEVERVPKNHDELVATSPFARKGALG
ncbi:hypothetical protein MTQ12_13625 [Brevibacterium sp. R8603A2]|uniref:hypothetical protein n=1 Tax=Brevibacterium sp. R8603A2 TaxID=2929779 RepID=UPI001FFA3B58|nr:hypothetical protein [Brevibacterium sp. R8603A2]MCK1804076.1 hypothetical protein [Brevibacterium sp. R8603A2]